MMGSIVTYAVIFDVDGVLVDSYRAHFESWHVVAAEVGVTFTEQQFAATFGRTSRDIIKQLWGEKANMSDERIAELDDRKEAEYRRIIADDFPHMDGAVELIEALHDDGFNLAVGSSGPPANVELVLDSLDRREMFSAMVTGVDVTRGKPDPQVFQLAAERLGVPPECCAVVEDAPAGVAAANRAGMLSIGFASTGRAIEELNEARLAVHSLGELTPQIIRRHLPVS
ncbi:MAG: HAD family phosphatase [Phycisphaerales bacterium]|nr:MAG: HAD family phosphatase [Phycisphaerales bacterium]